MMAKDTERPAGPRRLPSDGEPSSGNDEMIGRLLDFAGPRPQVPTDFLAEVKRTAEPAWQAKVAAHDAARRRNRYRWLAAAAVLMLAVGFTWQQTSRQYGSDQPTVTAPVAIATVETVVGSSWIASESKAAGLTVDQKLMEASEIETAAGGQTALRLADGTSLRLDAATRIHLESPSRLTLKRGAVYLDSGTAAASIEVHTPFGVARDIGTQFEVRLRDSTVEVRVREGEVEVETEAKSHRVAAGSAIEVASDGSFEVENISHFGPAWSWVLTAAPTFEADGKSLSELLEWVARETGWQLLYADTDLEAEASQILVRSSIAGLTPDETPTLAIPSAGLGYRLEDGRLIIERAGS